ncbi:hypothetical protein DCS_02888 [Drechmeria coniospora]|uniref:DASH complex subunit DAD2 n=1 Tax=Drechmeria coniospora TaxID=98403 RepID=A0A151GXA9_DRECN|nr:hypothetical protein DCS_02888 [Drechmeria coniospora]KYK61745.1 hypothetical protein DCS_02888 [Drechmeria coniospora]
MSYATRSLSTQHLRGPSGSSSTSSQSPALVARIEEKKGELQHLQELRDLSASVATQMEALERKLSTLSEGTEATDDEPIAIAAVMSNWHNVLRAINMASGHVMLTASSAASLAGPSGAGDESAEPLPQTLVRIPTEHAPTLQAQAEAAEAAVAAAATADDDDETTSNP